MPSFPTLWRRARRKNSSNLPAKSSPTGKPFESTWKSSKRPCRDGENNQLSESERVRIFAGRRRKGGGFAKSGICLGGNERSDRRPILHGHFSLVVSCGVSASGALGKLKRRRDARVQHTRRGRCRTFAEARPGIREEQERESGRKHGTRRDSSGDTRRNGIDRRFGSIARGLLVAVSPTYRSPESSGALAADRRKTHLGVAERSGVASGLQRSHAVCHGNSRRIAGRKRRELVPPSERRRR